MRCTHLPDQMLSQLRVGCPSGLICGSAAEDHPAKFLAETVPKRLLAGRNSLHRRQFRRYEKTGPLPL